MILGVALLGCAGAPEPPPSPAGAAATHVQASVEGLGQLNASERARLLAVLRGAQPDATDCYKAGLRRDAGLHGDLLVALEIAADGGVRQAGVAFSTLSDKAMERCVVEAVSELRFEEPSRDGLRVRYPFVFTSEATPPEVRRALLIRHGLLVEEPPNLEQQERALRGKDEPSGWVESW